MYDFLAILIAYFCGAIPFGYFIPKIFGIADIRKIGSGNVGATNAWRAAGPWAGILVLAFDIAKGMLAVAIAGVMPNTGLDIVYLKLVAGLAAILGHIFSIFMRFRGGKGVNTALGVMLILLPLEALISLAVFIVAVSCSRYISLGSIMASSAFFLVIMAEVIFSLKPVHPVFIVVSLLLAVLIIYTHRSNIRRLLNGTENRFNFHSSAEERVR